MAGMMVHERSAFLRILQLVDLVGRPLDRTLQEQFDLSLTEWRVLAVIAARHGTLATAVADALGIDKMATSRAVRELELAGHVARETAPRDRRAMTLRLTAAGKTAHGAIRTLMTQRDRALLAGLSAEERRSFDALLGRVLERIHPDQPVGKDD